MTLDEQIIAMTTPVVCGSKGGEVTSRGTGFFYEDLPDGQAKAQPDDTANLFPIIKSGIIASSWGKPFDGDPCFLIDCQLFPGSSGGLVLSKPTVTVHGIPTSRNLAWASRGTPT